MKKKIIKKVIKKKAIQRPLTNLELNKKVHVQDTKIEMLIAIINSMSEEHQCQAQVNISVKKRIELNIKRLDHLENFLDSVQAELISDDDEERIIN